MRKPQSYFLVVMTVALATVPRLAEAGPCSSDIADLETAIHLPRLEPRGGPERQSTSVAPNHLTPELAGQAAERLQSQFSATVARARRLDMHGDRVGCTGAINAARGKYVLVDSKSQFN
jgi:hypothetical protein